MSTAPLRETGKRDLRRALLLSRDRLGKFISDIAPYETYLVVLIAMAILIPGIWAYTLIDPWETHYAEVARRILAENDWVFIKAEDQAFRSKPILTFWLIGASMKALGVAAGGGYSGELTSSSWVIFAIRVPFALSAVMGVTVVFHMLAKLVNRRVAWIAFLLITCTPFFFLVARQSITDMPMVASMMAAISCFALASHAGDEPLVPIWKKLTALHVFLAVVVLLIGTQLVYLFIYFKWSHPGLAQGVNINPGFVLWPLTLIFVGWCLSLVPRFHWPFGEQKAHPFPLEGFPATTKRQVYMFWFYLLIGLSVLAKGPPGFALAGLICLTYTFVTGQWKMLLRLEILRGVVLTALVAVPWHFAMFLKDGQPWFNEYFNHHMLNRFGKGVHGDTGTFDYFASQLGIGMFPWIALLPVALATVLYGANRETPEGRTRLLVGIWAIAGVATFCISETKFHHYILPAVPALSIMIAFWIDDYLAGRVQRVTLGILIAVPIVLLLARDFVGEEKQFIELFIYRYDRAWPSGEPWHLTVSSGFMWFGAIFALLMAGLVVRRTRQYMVLGLLGAGLAFAFWLMNSYMPAAAPHWGQRELHRTYYAQRQIHGLDLQYYSLRDLRDDWKSGGDVEVKSVLPEKFEVGAPMKVQIFVPGAGIPEDKLVLTGSVSRLGDNAFWIAISDDERAKLSDLMVRGAEQKPNRHRPWRQVNADRMVAWQLNWHGEDFWSGGEMYGDRDDAKTIFKSTDNKEFLEWLGAPERAGRTYFIITEAARAAGLKGILPTPHAKETHEIIDTSCNKFTLVRFSL